MTEAMISATTKNHEVVRAEFAAALQKQGLVLDGPPEMDGQFHRVAVADDKPGKLSGSYIGNLDGQPNGLIQNFKSGAKVRWRSDNPAFVLTPEERVASAERQRAKADARLKEQEERANWVGKEWQALPDAPNDHRYLQRKHVNAHGLKLDKNGNLVMPLHDIDGKLWSVQRISAQGDKLFTKGGRTAGCFSPVGTDDLAKPIVIAEGYATSASIHEITGLPVVCALNAGNLKPVAQAFREKYPERPIFIAGDNDHLKEAEGKPNVGREKSFDAALAVGGFTLLPEFRPEDKGTDWNDLAQSEGEQVVREQIEAAINRPDMALGNNPVEPENAVEQIDDFELDTQSVAPHLPTDRQPTDKPVLTTTDYEVPAAIASRYVLRDGGFWKFDSKSSASTHDGQPQFEDKGKRLVSANDDRKTIADMLVIAQAKNWQAIAVKGSDDFKRHAWLEANLLGIRVKGFEPKEQDLAQLEAARRERDTLRIGPGNAPHLTPAQPVNVPDNNEHQSTTHVPTDERTQPTVQLKVVRDAFEKSIAQFPENVQRELTTRFNARMKAGVELQQKVVNGELPCESLGAAINTRFAELKTAWDTPHQEGASPAPMQPTPHAPSHPAPKVSL